jgi:hypothetical protein
MEKVVEEPDWYAETGNIVRERRRTTIESVIKNVPCV